MLHALGAFSPAARCSVLPVMQWVHRTTKIYDGRLPDRHIWRHLLLAASTARTSAFAMELLVSAGSGKSCCLLSWRPLTVVSIGRHLRSDRSATIAPLLIGMPMLRRMLVGSAVLALAGFSVCSG